MSEKPEREPLSLRMDPSLQLIMKGFKRAMGVRSVDDVYDQVVRSFIVSNPELAAQVQDELINERAATDSAITELSELRASDQT